MVTSRATIDVFELFCQDNNGGSLSNESGVTEKNSCYCTHNSSPQARKTQETQDANYFNSRLKRKPDLDGDRYKLLLLLFIEITIISLGDGLESYQ